MKEKGLIPYKTKELRLSGTDEKEVTKKALAICSEIKRRTKRKPYMVA